MRLEGPPEKVEQQSTDVLTAMAECRSGDLVAREALEQAREKVPAAMAASRSESVAAINRTSIFRARVPPRGKTSPRSTASRSIF
jgi:hypothetical protein